MIKSGPIHEIIAQMWGISNSEAKNLVRQGAISINDSYKADLTKIIKFPDDFLYDKYCVIKKGKRDYRMLIVGSN
jgi:tyrosyl-tRNA synthetase